MLPQGMAQQNPQEMTYDDFLKTVAKPLDLDWRKYRRRSARRRVEKRMRELGLAGYEQYIDLLHTNPEESRKLPDLMRITISRFFREQSCWQELSRIMPELFEARQSRAPLRAWCVGCCNGEEAYSLAILFLGAFGTPMDHAEVDILATDIDEEVLARARAGCYESRTLREAPPEILARFFFQSGHQKCIDERVRSLVRLEKHDFMKDAPPRQMDLVLCRYLAFTYFLGQRRRFAAERLWAAMKPGAALMIGRKEEIGPGEEDLFESWPGTTVLFRKRASP